MHTSTSRAAADIEISADLLYDAVFVLAAVTVLRHLGSVSKRVCLNLATTLRMTAAL